MASKVSLSLMWLFLFKSLDHYFKQKYYWSPKPDKSIKGMKIWDIGRNQLKSSCISVTSSWQVFEARDLETLQSIVCLYNQRSPVQDCGRELLSKTPSSYRCCYLRDYHTSPGIRFNSTTKIQNSCSSYCLGVGLNDIIKIRIRICLTVS